MIFLHKLCSPNPKIQPSVPHHNIIDWVRTTGNWKWFTLPNCNISLKRKRILRNEKYFSAWVMASSRSVLNKFRRCFNFLFHSTGTWKTLWYELKELIEQSTMGMTWRALQCRLLLSHGSGRQNNEQSKVKKSR
jgi:hypothetical protein